MRWNKRKFLLSCMATCAAILSNPGWSMDSDLLLHSQQLILVVTPDWQSVNGQMQWYERRSTDHEWVPVNRPVPVVVGKNGMAWGSGLHDIPSSPAFLKKEGDGKSPAGVFTFSHAFGLLPPSECTQIKLPYLQLTSAIECVDDASSPFYNQIINRNHIAEPDWKSSEKMAEFKKEYRLGIVIEHNLHPVQRGGGSCIFMHIWNGPDQGTAGCTAMSEEHMIPLIQWIDPKKNPLLIQLPKEEILRQQPEWAIPMDLLQEFGKK